MTTAVITAGRYASQLIVGGCGAVEVVTGIRETRGVLVVAQHAADASNLLDGWYGYGRVVQHQGSVPRTAAVTLRRGRRSVGSTFSRGKLRTSARLAKLSFAWDARNSATLSLDLGVRRC